MNTTKHDRPGAVAGQVDCRGRPQRQYTRDELVDALRMVGESMGGACAQAADMLAADGTSRLLPGDFFTHDRTGTRFVCRAVTRHDYGGIQIFVRAEVELAA
jgi:hypothetical protein